MYISYRKCNCQKYLSLGSELQYCQTRWTEQVIWQFQAPSCITMSQSVKCGNPCFVTWSSRRGWVVRWRWAKLLISRRTSSRLSTLCRWSRWCALETDKNLLADGDGHWATSQLFICDAVVNCAGRQRPMPLADYDYQPVTLLFADRDLSAGAYQRPDCQLIFKR